MLPSLRFRLCASLVVVIVLASPVSAADAGKLLPAETEFALTFNLRQFLDDHQETEPVQRYLEPLRLALQGDEKLLQKYYQAQPWLKAEGLSEQDFLNRAKLFKSVSDALGIDLLKDVDRVSCGFKSGAPGSWAVIVEGRFKEEKLRTAIRLLAKQYFGSSKATKVGDIEVWQIPEDGSGVNVAVLNDRTVAFAGNKQWLDDLLARAAGKKNGGLSAGMRSLLDSAAKEHVGLVANNVRILLTQAGKLLEEAGVDPKDALVKLIVTQLTSWISKNGDDVAAASAGLSLGVDELRLQFGLETKKPALADELQTSIRGGAFLAGFALRAVDDEFLRQLSGILLRIRVSGQDGTVVVRGPVPYAVLKQTVQGPGRAVLEAVSRRVSSITLWRPPQPPPAGALAVEEVRDIAYRDDAKADPYRHRLDLYLPKGKKDCPVVVLVHGGGWILGDNRCCGLYSSVGQFLASQGIVAVLPNYRLSPPVKHPEHVKDVARAVRWTRSNIAKHGGNPDRLFLAGHSAGGHLVSLLATDESYLKAEGLKTADIQGVVSVSGVYHIPAEDMVFTLGGSGPRAARLDQLFPLRGESGALPHLPVGLPFKPDAYSPAFGDDPKDRAAASPLTHVHRGLPPFLLVTAEYDLPTVADMADEFHQALRREGCAARLLKVGKRNHSSVLFSVIAPDDPAARAILEFVRQQEKKK